MGGYNPREKGSKVKSNFEMRKVSDEFLLEGLEVLIDLYANSDIEYNTRYINFITYRDKIDPVELEYQSYIDWIGFHTQLPICQEVDSNRILELIIPYSIELKRNIKLRIILNEERKG